MDDPLLLGVIGTRHRLEVEDHVPDGTAGAADLVDAGLALELVECRRRQSRVDDVDLALLDVKLE